MHPSHKQIQSPISGFSECFQQDFLFEPASKGFTLEQKVERKPQNSASYISSYETNLKNLLDTYGESSQLEIFSLVKFQHHPIHEQEAKIEPGKRPAKLQKAGQYSKNYREKKKERVKMLEQQNDFLKRKVDELQNRFREKQMELSRIKFAAKKQEYDIQKLNEEMTTKLSLIADVEPVQEMKEQKKSDLIEQEKKMPQFLKFFQVYGCGGQKTKQILDYYVNEFLENVMRDREKYYFMKCLKKQGLKDYKTPLDYALKEVMEQTTDQQAKNSIKMYMELRPLAFGIKQTCREFYKSYKKLIGMLEKTHHILKAEFQQSLELTKKRLRIILWFQQNQYSKEVRNLRAEWIQMVEGDNECEEEEHGETGKKKTHH